VRGSTPAADGVDDSLAGSGAAENGENRQSTKL
jgi:hypothetical protein